MSAIAHVQDSRGIRDLAAARRRVALTLTLLLSVAYFGFLAMIVFARSLVAVEVAQGVTLGLWAGAGVIVWALLLTIGYVAWANGYDHDVQALR